jgi:hypothetical protein
MVAHDAPHDMPERGFARDRHIVCQPLLSFLDELEEDASRRPAPGPIFGQHATVRLTGACVREDGCRPVWSQYPQHLCEQIYVGLLEDLRELVDGAFVHGISSRVLPWLPHRDFPPFGFCAAVRSCSNRAKAC